MAEIFKLRVVSRRQVTLPSRVLDLLHLREGDILEISVEEDSIKGRGLRLVPANLFTPEILEQLQKREEEINSGSALEAKHREDLVSKLTRRAAAQTASRG